MILAIDTATRWLGIALYDPEQAQVVYDAGWIALRTQTIDTAAAVEEALRRFDLTPAALQGVAVAAGPGSYTGLRIALSLAKGLALAHGTPLLPVPTFDILTVGLPADDRPLWTIAEAGRRRVLAAGYRWRSDAERWQLDRTPDVYDWPALLDTLAEPTLLTGEISAVARQMMADRPLAQPLPPAACVRQAGALAQLGWQQLQAGEAADPATFTPDYLRKPEGS